MDLIDMQSCPDGKYNWILHVKDHFTKYSFAYALKHKTSEKVAMALDHLLGIIAPPKMIQCDNGTEFLGDTLRLLNRYDVPVSCRLT